MSKDLEAVVDVSESTPTAYLGGDKEVGEFYNSLRRSNSKIREDRARVIASQARLNFRRAIEDLQIQIERIEMDRSSLIDLSPTNSMNLINVNDFDAIAYVTEELKYCKDLRNLRVQLEEATTRYTRLFGSL